MDLAHPAIHLAAYSLRFGTQTDQPLHELRLFRVEMSLPQSLQGNDRLSPESFPVAGTYGSTLVELLQSVSESLTRRIWELRLPYRLYGGTRARREDECQSILSGCEAPLGLDDSLPQRVGFHSTSRRGLVSGKGRAHQGSSVIDESPIVPEGFRGRYRWQTLAGGHQSLPIEGQALHLTTQGEGRDRELAGLLALVGEIRDPGGRD
jgi:hypothetical protein